MSPRKPRPRFYSTSVKARQSVMEIQDVIARYGARSFGLTYDDEKRPVSVHFVIPDDALGEVPVEIKPPVESIAKRLPGWNLDRAYDIAWRQTKERITLMLELVESGGLRLHEAFMADVMIPDRTGGFLRLADAFTQARGRLSLPASTTVDADFEEVR